MEEPLAGILLGTAVGDALGLPTENLSPRRIRRLWPGPWRHRFLLNRGMVSDDTEHTLFVAQALLAAPDDPSLFQRRFAWKLRWWILALPAGVGFATLRSCFRLWLGFPPSRSGVWSAGNGPAMRSAIIGGYFHDAPETIDAFTRAATTLSHTDPRSLIGALAVARLAAWATQHGPETPPPTADLLEQLRLLALDDEEWRGLIDKIENALKANRPVDEFARDSLGLEKGVSGYVYHSVPVAIYAWLRHYGDFRATLQAALDCGGDTDTFGAITGALAGATVGPSGVPTDWIDGLWEWPRSTALLRRVAARLARQKKNGVSAEGPVPYFWPAILPRNLFFLPVILLHVFRRLLPPY